jgi:hypothetical protein
MLGAAPGYRSRGHLQYRQMADRTRPIVRLDDMEGMVTKGYRKGVYRRVTKGITMQNQSAALVSRIKRSSAWFAQAVPASSCPVGLATS